MRPKACSSMDGVVRWSLVLGLLLVSAEAWARHPGSWTGEIGGVGPAYEVQSSHADLDPFKGPFTVTVTNTGSQPWGDFHFGIFDPIGGQDISNVGFLDASMNGEDPTSSQSGLSWIINNDIVGATIDLYFCTDPVLPGETAFFTVYTDNPDHLSFFGVLFYPTPVPPVGACCDPSGTCLLACQYDCPPPNLWLGALTSCDPNPCPQPTGACCDHATGDCTITTQENCPFDWLGAGVPCNVETCPPPPPPTGACCDHATGDCVVTTQASCPFDWLGPDVPCSVETCPPPPPPTGACCDHTTGGCTITTQENCPFDWLGAGVPCNVETCPPPPPPTGACCDHATGDCTITTQADCAFDWLGPDVPCTIETCVPPVPTEPSSWGRIKSIYR